MWGGFFFSNKSYFCDGAATAFATGVAGGGVGVAVLAIGLEGAVFCDCGIVMVGVGAFGFPDPDVDDVETVRTGSFFSGQNKIARIAMTSRTITIVGQWALVKLQRDDACAVCGTALFAAGVVAGWVCATTVVDGVVVMAAIGAEPAGMFGIVAADGALFTATDEPAG
jgi:hypothetical protein